MKALSAWEQDIQRFWEVVRHDFVVQTNHSAGSHIHVAPVNRNFTLGELRTIAFAVIINESSVCQTLPQERRDSSYCARNSKVSRFIGNNSSSAALKAIAIYVRNISTKADLCRYMQDGDRKVLWNFQNTVGSTPSGTVEFRGGRHLRGPVRTRRWITYVLAFIAMALKEVCTCLTTTILRPPNGIF